MKFKQWLESTQMSPTQAMRILGLGPGYSPADLKDTYRRLALQLHPDRPNGDGDRFAQVSNAYSALSGRAKVSNPAPEYATVDPGTRRAPGSPGPGAETGDGADPQKVWYKPFQSFANVGTYVKTGLGGASEYAMVTGFCKIDGKQGYRVVMLDRSTSRIPAGQVRILSPKQEERMKEKFSQYFQRRS